MKVAADALPIGEQGQLALVLLQLPSLELEGPPTQRRLDGDEDLVGGERLDQVAVHAHPQCLCGDLRVIDTSDHHQHGARRIAGHG